MFATRPKPAFILILWLGLFFWAPLVQGQTPEAPASPSPVELMVKGMLSESTELALRQEYAAALLKNPEAYPALIDILKSSNNHTTKKILCQSISQLTGSYLDFTDSPLLPKEFINPLLDLMRIDDTETNNWAARAVLKCSNGVVHELAMLVQNSDEPERARLAGITALKLVPSQESVQALAKLLTDDQATVRQMASDSICEMLYLRKPLNIKEFDENVLPGLLKLKQQTFLMWLLELRQKQIMQYESSNIKLQQEAEKWRKTYLAGETDKFETLKIKERLAMLTTYLSNNTEEAFRLWAIQRIIQWNKSTLPIEEKSPAQILKLIEPELSDPVSRVRQLAVESLTTFDIELVRPYGVQLLKLLETEQIPEVQTTLLNTLGAMEYVQALEPALTYWERSENKLVSAAAVKTMGRLLPALDRQQTETVIQSLAKYYPAKIQWLEPRRELILTIEILADNPQNREMMTKLFGELLNRSLKDSGSDVRSHAIYTLIKLAKKDCLSILLEARLFEDPDPTVRFALLTAFDAYGDSTHLSLLKDRYLAETDIDIKKHFLDTLTKILSGMSLNEVYNWSTPLFADDSLLPLQERLVGSMVRRLESLQTENKAIPADLETGILKLQIQLAKRQQANDILVTSYLRLIKIAASEEEKNQYRQLVLSNLLDNGNDKNITLARPETLILLSQSAASHKVVLDKLAGLSNDQADSLYRRARMVADFITPLTQYPDEALKKQWSEMTHKLLVELLNHQELMLTQTKNHDPRIIELMKVFDERFVKFPANGTVDERIVFLQNIHHAMTVKNPPSNS